MSVEKIKEMEDKVKKRHKLVLDGYNHNQKLPLKDFIHSFLGDLNQMHSTIYKTSGNSQCRKGRRRSASDVFLVCKSYYPNVTMKQVMTHLVELVNEAKIKTIYCGMINKRVYRKNMPEQTTWNSIYGKDEFGFVGKDYLSLINK